MSRRPSGLIIGLTYERIYEDNSPLCCIVPRFLLMTKRGVPTDASQVMV